MDPQGVRRVVLGGPRRSQTSSIVPIYTRIFAHFVLKNETFCPYSAPLLSAVWVFAGLFNNVTPANNEGRQYNEKKLIFVLFYLSEKKRFFRVSIIKRKYRIFYSAFIKMRHGISLSLKFPFFLIFL